MQSTLAVEVGRLKKLFQHPDLALTTSPRVEVSILHEACPLDAENGQSAYVRSTRAVKEESSPFFNETLVFDLTPVVAELSSPQRRAAAGQSSESTESSAARVLRLLFRVFNVNTTPHSLVGVAVSQEICFYENGKGDGTLTLRNDVNDTSEDHGQLSFKFSLKVVLPSGPVIDADADVDVDPNQVLRGDTPLAAADRFNVWFHFARNASWRERLWKMVVTAFPLEAPKKGRSTKGRGTAPSSTAPSDPVSSMAAVVKERWNCKRLHQYMTKARLAATRQLLGYQPETLPWTAAEELEWKQRWANDAVMRRNTIVVPSKKIRDALERYWVLYLTGELPSDAVGATLTFEQRSKMASAVFGRTQYEAVVSALIEAVDPNLAGAPVVALIAKETFEADPKMTGSRAFKAAQSVAATEKPRPSEASYEHFKRLVMHYCDWWAETYTETEYCSLLATLQPSLLSAKERADIGGTSMKASKRRSSSAPKRRRGGSKSKRKSTKL